MTGILQLTDQANPLAQTFRVTEAGGSCITSVGLWFSQAPSSGSPVNVELRPVVEGGNPSGTRYYEGARASASAATVNAAANATFSSATEVKFTFDTPIFIPYNSEVAIVISTSQPAGSNGYKIWVGTQGEHVAGNTTTLITHDLNSGVMFKSSNGTAWTADQYTDIAFKVYRAVFRYDDNRAHLVALTPPKKRLTELQNSSRLVNYPDNPLVFTSGSANVAVIHPAHGFQVGDKVTLYTDSDGYDSADTINGISGANLLGTKTITAIDPYGYTFNCGSNATNTMRAGGSSVQATEQYVVNNMQLSMQYVTPSYTSLSAGGALTTTTSFAGTETPYLATTNIYMPVNTPVALKHPHVITSAQQETDKLSGDPSTVVDVKLFTSSKYVAPYFNAASTSLKVSSYFIDYQDSDSSPLIGNTRNDISTLVYAAETSANGGTNASKYLTVPIALEDVSSSIRLYMDAINPEGAGFDVWYRTAYQASNTALQDVTWTKFSRSPNIATSYSNYDIIGSTDTFRQFEFNAYDITDFDLYQIKITMYSNRSSNVPIITNLRTIATA